MPDYNVIYQAGTPRTAAGRATRGDESAGVTCMLVKGVSSAMQAIMTAEQGFPNMGLDPRIVAVEEVCGTDPLDALDDAALTRVLSDEDTGNPLYPEDYEDHTAALYDDTSNFLSTASQVVNQLSASQVFPGLSLSLLAQPESYIDYTMVEVHDEAMRRYAALGCEIDDLTQDRSAVGWSGVLALARGISQIASRLN